jgi:hypothetical protein
MSNLKRFRIGNAVVNICQMDLKEAEKVVAAADTALK